MSKTLQFRRYTTSNLASITGASGELIVDTTLNQITVHDGNKAGGWYAANAITLQTVWNTANAAANAAGSDLANTGGTLTGNLLITGTANVRGNLYSTTITTATGSGGNLTIDPDGYGDVIFTPYTEVFIQSSNTSVNTTTGALIVSGGLGVAGNVFTGGLIETSGNGIGYSTGAGGTVTQGTSRTTGVTLNKPSGQITLFSQALAAGAANTFVLTNSTIAANDFILLNHFSGGTLGNYVFAANTSAGQANVTVRSITTVTAEAPVVQYVIIKGATS